MSNLDVIRAWKDEDYRNSLEKNQRDLLPKNPAGIVELDDQELKASVGGGTHMFRTFGCCPIPM